MTDKFRFGCLIGLLLLTTADLRWVSHGHPVPIRSDFGAFPTHLGDWSGKDLPDLDEKTKEVLRADNYLWRDYRNSTASTQVNLFIVYYRSQRSGDALHSPKNCLPGGGWEPVSSGAIRIFSPDNPDSGFRANHYVIEKDGVQQDVLYWYQAHGRRFASEYLGKIYLVWDGITKGRTDGALIRITTARAPGDTQSFPAMVKFAQEIAPVLPVFLPN